MPGSLCTYCLEHSVHRSIRYYFKELWSIQSFMSILGTLGIILRNFEITDFSCQKSWAIIEVICVPTVHMYLYVSEQVFILFYVCNSPLLDSQIVKIHKIDSNAKDFFVLVIYFTCTLVSLCAYAQVYMCHRAHVNIRGQLVKHCSLLPSYGFWEMNSGPQAWHQIPLSTEHAISQTSKIKVLNPGEKNLVRYW